MQHVSEKTISGVTVSAGGAEALVICGEKMKHLLVASFLCHIIAIFFSSCLSEQAAMVWACVVKRRQ